MLRFALAVSLLAIPVATHAQAAPTEFTPEQKAQMIGQMKDKLFDGESARWRWPAISPKTAADGKGSFYCGFVNAKNRFGAYVGFKPYLAMVSIKPDGNVSAMLLDLSNDDPRDTSAMMVATLCPEYGYSLTQVPPE